MYIGKKEPDVRIIIEQYLCQKYDDKSGKRWIEIFVPPEDKNEWFDTKGRAKKKSWQSFVVRPDQVNFIPNSSFNLLCLRNEKTIHVTRKTTTHVPVTNAWMSPADITGRILKYHYFKNHPAEPERTSEEIYKEWVNSGLRMNIWIEHCSVTPPATQHSQP